MREQGKQNQKPKAVKVRKCVASSTLYIQHDNCESCGIYSFNQPSDCGLDPMVPTAGRLEELGICSGFKHQLLVSGEISEHWLLSQQPGGCAFPRELAGFWWPSCWVPAWAPQEGQGGEKEGLGLGGTAWPMFSPQEFPLAIPEDGNERY